ncbi:hypothetical protein [Streptomyces violaceusniger]|uniref:Uncharacterized protein n=1 Tax=Streptomyces violaceusniger (strain Tu 4113) TaxID=653045 RepID=G2P4V2_STRV4|nr:hypothetical protein [Streptomyces violaceusniger]AEM83991.1 hypothetical protein Strvi_4345 [Streptomyces violaceusniger Tu 4113]
MDITAPDGNHCGDGATGDQPVGCTGIRIGGFERCLGHLGQEERHACLATLTPGDVIVPTGGAHPYGFEVEPGSNVAFLHTGDTGNLFEIPEVVGNVAV